MADGLRQRYADLVTRWFKPGERLAHLSELLAVRDEELERLRDAARIVVANDWYGRVAKADGWRERAEKAEAANTRARERLDALIADGFGAVGDTLRELRTLLDGNQEATSRRAPWAPIPVPRWAAEALTGPSTIQEKAQAERALKTVLAALDDTREGDRG